MVKAGDGYRVHVTGLTHDERGYPKMDVPTQAQLVTRLLDKIHKNADKLVCVEMDGCDDADIVVLSYGITSRVTTAAVDAARAKGLKVGHLRLIICWPFPATLILELAQRVKAFVFPELNMGQMVRELERVVAGRTKVVSAPHPGGTVHEPEAILAKILEAAR